LYPAADIPQEAAQLLAPKAVQTCLSCAQENERRNASAARLRSSLQGWRVTCRICGSALAELDEQNQPRPQKRIVALAHLWPEALQGQNLFENAIVHNSWPWASPIHILRLLLVRRSCKSVDLSKGIDKGCTVNLIVPSFDEIVCRLSLWPLRKRSLVLPISIRPALLAAVSIVVDQGPDAIEVLAEAAIGGYRLQFDKIVSQMRAEVRIRQADSQLLQS
jgi:hypothetical protein